MLILAETSVNLDYFASFGLGVIVLVVAVWWLSRQLEKCRLREIELNNTIVSITREALTGMGKLTAVIEGLSPIVGNISARNAADLATATKDLKEHITNTVNHLTIVAAQQGKGIVRKPPE